MATTAAMSWLMVWRPLRLARTPSLGPSTMASKMTSSLWPSSKALLSIRTSAQPCSRDSQPSPSSMDDPEANQARYPGLGGCGMAIHTCHCSRQTPSTHFLQQPQGHLLPIASRQEAPRHATHSEHYAESTPIPLPGLRLPRLRGGIGGQRPRMGLQRYHEYPAGDLGGGS